MFLIHLFPTKVIRLTDGEIECPGVDQIKFLIDDICLPDAISKSPGVFFAICADQLVVSAQA